MIPAVVGFVLLAGEAIAAVATTVLARAGRTRPVVHGRIVRSRLDVRRDPPGSRFGHHATARMRYAFDVDGARYEGSRVRWGTTIASSDRDDQQTVNRLPVGATVRTRHHPTRHSLSTLGTSMSRTIYLWLVLRVVIALLMIAE